MDLVIEGKAYINNKFEQCCIGIEKGKIIEIKKILKGDEHIKFKNKLILPAGVDAHVHFRDPGMTQKEDFSTGSTAAAFGGITCVFDMPNTIPQTITNQDITDKIDIATKKSLVDFGINAGVTNSNIKDIKNLGKKCSGFKIYLGSSTNSLLLDDKNLKVAFLELEKTKRPVLFHAEDERLLLKHKINENNLKDHLKSRPSICEATSIRHILNCAKETKIRGHICHISSIEGLEELRNKPSNFSIGATPHHILLNIEKNYSPATNFKVNPPIRTNFDRETLFNSLKLGIIDILESDHAPHNFGEKDVDFNLAPSGVPGVETIYPIGLYLVKKELMPIERLISAMCEKPANLMNVKKGFIKPGFDADFIITNLKDRVFIDSGKLHYKCGWTPFEGWPAIFPETVFLRGEKLIDEGEIQVKQGYGNFVGE
jgi:dihydroorotase